MNEDNEVMLAKKVPFHPKDILRRTTKQENNDTNDVVSGKKLLLILEIG